jgi:general secretion pathway protein L
MVATLGHPLAHDAIAIAADMFGWWRRTLWEMIPPRFQRRLAPEPPMLALDETPRGFAFGMVVDGRYEALAEAPSLLSGASAVLRLAESQVLRRRIDLPLTSNRRLRGLLGFEIERQTPLTLDQAYYHGEVLERDAKAGRMTVELVVAKRAVVNALLDEARNAGFIPRIVTPPGVIAAFRRRDLLPPSPPSMADRGRIAITAALLALCAGLLIAVANAADTRQAAALAALRMETARAREAAEETKALGKRADALAERLAFLSVARRRSVGAALDAVAGALPDDTWLTELALDGTELRLQGNSGAATALIAALDAAPQFADAHFAAPLTRAVGGNGAERFVLAVRIRDGAVP